MDPFGSPFDPDATAGPTADAAAGPTANDRPSSVPPPDAWGMHPAPTGNEPLRPFLPPPPPPTATSQMPVASRHPGPPQWQTASGYSPIPPAPPAAYGALRPPAPVPTPWYRRVVAGLIVVALIAGVLAVVFRQSLFPSAGDYPDKWDPRVTEIVRFVENTRGLTFKHPIPINFLAEADFVHLFDEPAGGGLDDETAKAYSDIYDAQGLAVGYDITAGESTVSAVTTLGYYTPTDDAIYIRGNELTAPVRVVLAHELTHALQGQYFDFQLGGADDLEIRSIVEADAMRVEDVYTSRLTEQERKEADAANTLSDDSADDLADVPWAVVEQRYAPYALGPELVADVFADGGNAGVDALIRNPPSESELLSPWTYGQGSAEAAIAVDTPTDAHLLEGPQALSELQLLIMFDAWLPWTEARGALDGWAGGGYASYEKGGKGGDVCFTAKVQLTAGAATFADAVRDWAAASGSSATPAVDGDAVTFEACARGSAAQAPATPIISPLQALVLEHDAVGLAGSDPTAEQIKGYQCFAAALIDDPIAAPLLWIQEERTDTETAAFRTQEDVAADACGVPRIIPAP